MGGAMGNNLPLPKLLVLARHGRDKGDEKSRKQKIKSRKFSTYLCHLTEAGREQVAALRNWLKGRFDFDYFYSSDYLRALETFHILYPNVSPIIDERLAEIRRGVEDLMTDKEIGKIFPWN